MRICLFEDRHAADLGPLTLTRPAFDLVCGLLPLAAKQARYFAPDAAGFLVRPALAGVTRDRHPAAPVNDPHWLRAGPTVLVNGRWVPPARPAGEPAPTTATLFAGGPFVGVCGGEVAYVAADPAMLAAIPPTGLDDCLDAWAATLPAVAVGGFVARRLWELVDANPAEIAADFAAEADPAGVGLFPAGLHLVGPADRLSVHPSAVVDPLVVADTTGGPVVIGAGAVVRAFSRLEGPCAVGPGTHLNGAAVRAGTTIGPHCRVGGEVEASIVLGYSNKAHDGFLGHSYVGEWVNLAAGTHTADLRGDYAEVRAATEHGSVPTGRLKVGAAVGDHAKTGLGVLLDCGASVGPFAAVLPTGRLAPRSVPGFTRVGPDGVAENLDFDALFATAAAVMRRRGRTLTPAAEAVYRAAAARTAGHRARLVGGGAREGLRVRRAG